MTSDGHEQLSCEKVAPGGEKVRVCGKEERGRRSLRFDLHALQLHDMVLVLG